MAEVEIVIGSITEQDVDAIVNSANTALIMGGGVAAAILAEAGPEVEEEAVTHAPISVGEVVVTRGGDLSARHILHVAVVGELPPDIYECTINVLERAAELEVASIAIPALGTGSAGISVRDSAQGMRAAIVDFCASDSTLQEIRVVLWDDSQFDTYERALRRARRESSESSF